MSRLSKAIETYEAKMAEDDEINNTMCEVSFVCEYKSNEGQDQRHSHGPGNEEEPSRKLLLELQHWFLLSPYNQIKNTILQELCVTASFVQTKAQVIKTSQCAQIGTNLIYGYFDKIDSTGLAYLLKMIAAIKVDVQDGKGFGELEEVSRIATNLFIKQQTQQKRKRQQTETVITDKTQFTKTVQGFVQCVSTLIADIQLPYQKSIRLNSSQQLNPKYVKMISFLISKFTMIVTGYQEWLGGNNWSFVSAFFITLCTNKHQPIQLRGIKYLGQTFKHFLSANGSSKNQDSNKSIELSPSNSQPTLEQINEEQIMNIYAILAKCRLPSQVLIQLLTQLKQHLFLLSSQQALMKGFGIVKDLYLREAEKNERSSLARQIQEIEEVLIKDCLYKMTKVQYLSMIIAQFGSSSVFTDKNMQYNLVTLIWAIADHFKKLFAFIQQQNQENLRQQYQNLWTLLFDRLLHLSIKSKQPEFKQSAFHAVTQIIAQNFVILNQLNSQLIVRFMSKNYLSMLFTLFDIPPHEFQNQRRIQMVKFAVKNYMKLIRKLIKDRLFVQGQDSNFIGNTVNHRLYEFISSQTDTTVLTVQYLYQICILIQESLQQPIGFNYLDKTVLLKLFASIKQKKLLLDTNTLHYRRKLQPLLQQLQIHLSKTKSVSISEDNLKASEDKQALENDALQENQAENKL